MTRKLSRVQPARETEAPVRGVSVALLAWYDRHRRDLPWRARPGSPSDPYRVWLSEIMLQQTTVAAVKPYYAAFLQRWPDVQALAAAPTEAVMQAWAGLGYYSRARNLHACATAVVGRFGGAFPDTEAELLSLPGIGPYTAAAIAAIAFGRRAVVVDGNVERVMARLFAIEAPLPDAKPTVRAAMDAVTPDARAGDFAQAMMDLGATICVPRTPACLLCPLNARCAGFRIGTPQAFPRKTAKKPVPVRQGAVFYVERDDGAVLVRSRPPKGLFGGMTELPGTEWSEAFDPASVRPSPGLAADLAPVGTVEHGLTHFSLILHVFRATLAGGVPAGHRWMTPADTEALPTLMRKVLAAADAGPATAGLAESGGSRVSRSAASSPPRGRGGRQRQ